MIEPFLGTWKLISSENFENYVRELGERHHYGSRELVASGFCVVAGFVSHDEFLNDFHFVTLGYTHLRQSL